MFAEAKKIAVFCIIASIIFTGFSFVSRDTAFSASVAGYEFPNMYGVNFERTNFYYAQGRSSNEVRWKADLKYPIYASPVMDSEGNVFFTDDDGNITGLSPLKGLNIFRVHIGSYVYSTPVIEGNRLYVVGGNPEYLYCFNIETAERVFRISLENEVHDSLLIYDNVIYFGDNNGNFYAYDVKNDNPNLLWKTGVNGKIISSPALYENGDEEYVIFGSTSGTLYCMDAKSGKQIWSVVPLSGGEINATPLIHNGFVYIGAGNDTEGKFVKIDVTNGKIEKSFDTDANIKFGATIFETKSGFDVAFGTQGGKIYVLDADSFDKISEFKSAYSSVTTPVSSDAKGNLYFGTFDRELIAITSDGKEIFDFKTRGKIDTAIIIGKDGTLFFGDDSGYGYALGYRTGDIVVYTNMEKSSFTLTGPITLHGSGKSYRFMGVPEGKYTITFSDIQGYVTPPSVTKFLSPNGNLIFTGNYKRKITPSNGTLIVVTNLEDAKFVVEDSSGKTVGTGSGKKTVLTLAPGTYTVKFGDVKGFVTPDDQKVEVKEKETTVVQVEYVKKPEENPNPPKQKEKVIKIVLKIGSPYMTVNGHIEEVDPGRGTAPVIIPKWSRTVVPIRAIIESLGGKISWDPKDRAVGISLGSKTIKIWIGKNVALVNGDYKLIDDKNPSVTPIIINDRTMVPVRFVAEELGCTVEWNGKTREITITYTVKGDNG